MNKIAQELLRRLNEENERLHREFEESWWQFRMGDHSYEEEMNNAERARDAFRSSSLNLDRVDEVLAAKELSADEQQRLLVWKNFFTLYQFPSELAPLRDRISALESQMAKKFTTRREGYPDPHTGNFVESSVQKMRMTMTTNPDEAVRKACFDSLEELALSNAGEYTELVKMRNEYARGLGYSDFYAYRLKVSEGMTKDQVFNIFGEVYDKTRYVFDRIRRMESAKPGLRKPWNFAYMMSGSFTFEEDPYFSFDEALIRWGRSFAALGLEFRGGKLQLDLLDRKGKYNNGFCHYPEIVSFYDGERIPGAANFTCNVVYGQPGSGYQGLTTLFHEGGHACDRLCSEQIDNCLNTEWPPASIAWAETHSQFLDTMLSSIEWRVRYAKDMHGNPYPLELFERKVRHLSFLAPLQLNNIMVISEFERMVYEDFDISEEKVRSYAKKATQKYYDYSDDFSRPLWVPHIYDWESSAYYHAYGLAILALEQWRKYFYDKYGFIVDNPEVGKEMIEVWKLGSAKQFPEFVKMATGKDLSPEAFIEDKTMNEDDLIQRGYDRVERLNGVPEFENNINLNANIRIAHGKEVVADNSTSFEDMAEKYKEWLHFQEKHT